MAKVIVVYESKYGNTKRVAETIVEGMKEVEGIEMVIRELKEVDLNRIPEYNVILVGSPNHFGGPTGSVRKFIDQLGKLPLEDKMFAVFDTYLAKDFEKAVKKMEKRIKEKAPRLKQIAPGLPIKVQGMKGPISDGELPKCKEFGNKIATQMKTWLPINYSRVLGVNIQRTSMKYSYFCVYLQRNGVLLYGAGL